MNKVKIMLDMSGPTTKLGLRFLLNFPTNFWRILCLKILIKLKNVIKIIFIFFKIN